MNPSSYGNFTTSQIGSDGFRELAALPPAWPPLECFKDLMWALVLVGNFRQTNAGWPVLSPPANRSS